MRDILDWQAPFGVIGRLADLLFLRRHMRWFVSTKQTALKRIAEARTGMTTTHRVAQAKSPSC